MDEDILRAWVLVHELSDQLTLSRKISSTLKSQAAAVNDQAAHASSGFVLRRYNTDISKEVFDSELERMNAQFIIENQTLLYENKQFGLLLREYESVMETIMSRFRTHALAAQQHELTLTRHYEGLLQACDAQNQYTDLNSETKTAASLRRLARGLRALHRSMSGEEPEENDHDDQEDSPVDISVLIETLDHQADSQIRDDWALERETEISRLEKENEELRKLLEIDPASLGDKGITVELEESARYSRSLLEGSRKRSESSASGSHLSPWAFDIDIPRERENNPWSGWESQPQSQSQPSSSPPPQRQQGQQRFQQQPQHSPLFGNGIRMQEAMYSNQLPYAKPMRRPANLFSPNPGPAPLVSVGSSIWPQSTPSKPDRWIQS